MKYTFILLTILLLTSCNNNKRSEFKGNIEYISEKSYSCSEKFGEPIKGRLIEGGSYYFDNKNITKYEIYNDEGEKKYSSETIYQKNKPISTKMEYEEYDTTSHDFVFIKKSEKLLDRNSKFEIWLDNKGDTIFYSLDKDGYIRNKKWKDIQGNTYINETIRDKENNSFEFKYSINNKLNTVVKSYFDDNNFKTKEETKNFEHNWEKVLTYKYKTDNIGNWIERITYDDNTPTGITIREIKYLK